MSDWLDKGIGELSLEAKPLGYLARESARD